MAPRYNWQTDRQMTAKEYIAILKELNMNIAQAARYLGVGERTSHRYKRAETPIPEAHVLLLRAMREYNVKPEVPVWVSDRKVRKA